MKNFLKYLIYALVGYLCLMLASCRTQKEIETVYVDRTRVIEDTIFKWDIDTFIVNKTITKTDTVTIIEIDRSHIQKKVENVSKNRIDTFIQYKYITKTEYKEKPIKWWQKGMMSLGGIFLLFLIFILYLHVKR